MYSPKKTIILTGGAGFIGSCFLWKLNQEGIKDIVVVDDLDESGKWKNLLGKNFIDYIQKDDFLEALESGKFPRINTIVHLGACSSTTVNDAAYLLKNNYEYSKRLAVWAQAHNSRFLYASSAATYGDGNDGYDDDESKLRYLKPLNAYGYSKYLFDLWMSANGLLNKTAGFKFFNVFGPNEYHKEGMMSVICRNFSAVNKGGPMRLFKSCRPDYADGAQKRDFIYVKDAVEVMYYFFCHPDKCGIFNLGTGLARTWNDLANAVFRALGRPPRIEYIDMPEAIRGKYQYFTEAKMEKIRKASCNYSFLSLEDSIRDYVRYLKDVIYL